MLIVEQSKKAAQPLGITYCILHLTSLSTGIGWNREIRKRFFRTTCPLTLSILCALNRFCKILKFARYSYSCFAFSLTRPIGTSPGSGRNECETGAYKTRVNRYNVLTKDVETRTVDRIEDLTVCTPRAHLLDLCVVYLQQVIDPLKEFRSRFTHEEQNLSQSLEI